MSMPQNQSAKLAKRFPWVLLLCSTIAFCILIALGTWQVQRLFWKEQLITKIEERTHSAAKPLAEVEAEFMQTGAVDYIPVTLKGTFRHDLEQYFFTTFNGAAGYAVYTPLILSDNRAILINRGFVPYEMQNPEKRIEGQITGEVTVTGLARDPLIAKPSSYLPDNEPAKKLYFWKDWGVMMETSGLSQEHDFVGFFVDADPTPNAGGLPVGGITILEQPNSHLQYAGTWFGLAGVLLVVTIIFASRQRRSKHQS